MAEERANSTLPFNLFSPEVLQDPYPLYTRIRSSEPVCWYEPMKAWLCMRYEDVKGGLRDRRLSSGKGKYTKGIDRLPPNMRERFTPLAEVFERQFRFFDPPDYFQFRHTLNEIFSFDLIQQFRPSIERTVDELLDRTSGQRMDLIGEFAYHLPALVIAKMLDVADADRSWLVRSADDLADYLGSFPPSEAQIAKAQESTLKMDTYFSARAQHCRQRLGKDPMSLLIGFKLGGKGMTDGEVSTQCIMLLFAGNETTRNLIGNGFKALLTHPTEMERLKENPALIGSAIEEFLRYESPVQFISRVAKEDLQIGEKRIAGPIRSVGGQREGEPVLLFIGAANRDPEQYSDPDGLDIARKNNNHLAFGHEAHMCVGASLARMEAQVAFATILRRMPHLRLETKDLEWRPNLNFRGLKALRVVW
jgi:cytochrome P450